MPEQNEDNTASTTTDSTTSTTISAVVSTDTNDSDFSTDTNDSNSTTTTTTPATFSRGDHVYQWCSFAGIPRVFQHHGIVMHVQVLKDGSEQLTIADFSNFLPESSQSTTPNNNQSAKESKEEECTAGEDNKPANPTATKTKKRGWKKLERKSQQSSASLVGGGTSTGGILRVYTTTSHSDPWYKVEYNTPRWKTVFQRSGVSTTMAASDCPEVVLNRVNFLILQAERNGNTFQSTILPKYHLLFANCECVAMWCKTGRWSTLQGASLLTGAAYGSTTMAIGQATAGSAVAVVGSAVEVAAVSEGFVGVVGVGATTQPWLMTALTAYGALTVGGCTGTLILAKSRWNATTKRLNEAFIKLEAANSIATPA